MRLAFKLIFALVACVVALLSIEAFVSVTFARIQYEDDVAHELGVLGRTVAAVVEDTWSRDGQARALELVEHAQASEDSITIRWVWLRSTQDPARTPIASAEQLAPARAGVPFKVSVVSTTGARSLVTYTPTRVDGGWFGAIEVAEPMAAAERHERQVLWRALSLTLLVAVIGVMLIATLGVRWVGRPLRALIDKTRRVAAGDLATPVELRTNDELQTLGTELDAMSLALAGSRDALREEADSRVRAIEQLRHADRLTTVGTLAAGVAHELGTPLNVISGHAGLLLASETDEAVLDGVRIIKEQTSRMTSIIRGLLEFARRKPASVELIDLRSVVEQTMDLLRPLAKKHGGTIAPGAPAPGAPAPGAPAPGAREENLFVQADPGQLQQVLSNLIINGLQSREGGATVTVGTEMVDVTPPAGVASTGRRYVRIDIRDDGVGINDETMAQVFEPFFTTKAVGEGTGLGLSIAHGLVAEHGGWIAVSSELDRGTCFSVYLPRATPLDQPASGATE